MNPQDTQTSALDALKTGGSLLPEGTFSGASSSPIAQPQNQMPSNFNSLPPEGQQFLKALDYARQNPNSDFANAFATKIRNGEMAPYAKMAGIDLTPYLQKTQMPTSTTPSTPSGGFLDTAGKVAGQVLGGVPAIENDIPGMKGFGTGFAKSFAGLPWDLQNLGAKIGNVVAGLIPGASKIPEYQKPSALEPQGTAENVGNAAGQVAQFFVPGSAESKAAEGLDKAIDGVNWAEKLGPMAENLGEDGINAIKNIAKVIGHGLVSGTSMGGVSAIQSGGDTGQTITGAALGGISPLVGKALGTAANKVFSSEKIGDVLANVIGEMTGRDPEAVKVAFQNPEIVAKGVSEGITPEDVRTNAISALKDYKTSYQSDFKNGLNDLKEQYPFGKTGKILTQQEVMNEETGLPQALRQLRIGVSSDGTLDFDKLNSSIVSGAERKNLQMIYDTINGMKNYSIQGVQDALARIEKLSSFTEGAQTVASKAAMTMMHSFEDAVGKSYPELTQLRATYAAQKGIADGIDQLLKSSKTATQNPTAVKNVLTNFQNIFKQNSSAYLEALQNLEKATGQDFISQLASTQFEPLYSKSIGSTLFQASAIAGGLFLHNPFLLTVLPLFSPNLMGKIITGVGKVAPEIEESTPAIVKGVTKIAAPLINNGENK